MLYASATSYGFINQLKDRLDNNIKIEHIGTGAASLADLNSMLKDEINDDRLSPLYTVVCMLGYDDIVRLRKPARDVRIELAHTVSYLADHNVTHIALATSFIFGDKKDLTNEFDEDLEELSGIIKRLSRLFNVGLIDVHMGLMKGLERYNIENIPSSILTFDGEHLNTLGHTIVANTLLTYFEVEPFELPAPPIKRNRFHNRYFHDELIEEEDFKSGVYVDEMPEFAQQTNYKNVVGSEWETDISMKKTEL
jgi:hypothetical protein